MAKEIDKLEQEAELLWKAAQPVEVDSYAGVIPPDKKTFISLYKTLKENHEST